MVIAKKIAVLTLFFAVAVLSWFYFGKDVGFPIGVETGTVTRGHVEEVVNETGFVQDVRFADLAFQSSGQVKDINVSEGAVVVQGDVLMTLNDERAKSEVASAEARLRAEQIRLDEMLAGADASSRTVYERAVETARVALENANNNLTQSTAQQNILVENAQHTMQSSALQASLISDERENTQYVFTPPTLTGTYIGEEGKYIVELYSSNAQSGSSFKYHGIESGTGEVSTIAPMPLGTKGLRIQFPDNFASKTEWEISIPNKKSSVYLTNLNAYNAAVKNREVAITTAENAVRSAESALAQAEAQLAQVAGAARTERIAAQRALIQQMSALVSQSKTVYENTSIKAPFSGVVANIRVEEGETINSGITVIELVSESAFEVIVNISEVDIAEINIGDKAIITLDAYDGVEFNGLVSEISPRVSVVGGVRVIPIKISLETNDPRMKDGFTAQVDIQSSLREGVLTIPSRAVYEDTDGKYVWVVEANATIKRTPVKTGLRGTNGFTEITEGVDEGIEIITFATTEVISQIKKH